MSESIVTTENDVFRKVRIPKAILESLCNLWVDPNPIPGDGKGPVIILHGETVWFRICESCRVVVEVPNAAPSFCPFCGAPQDPDKYGMRGNYAPEYNGKRAGDDD